MADASQIDFTKRLKRIEKRNRQLAYGYTTTVNHDGLLIARPYRQGLTFPWRGLGMVLLVLMIFKGFVIASLGLDEYADRVARLQAGTFAERAGAFVMKADPVTHWIATEFKSVLPEMK